MKAKLLKKVRRRYVITYYPKEVSLYGHIFYGECMILWDKGEEYRSVVGAEIGDVHRKHFEKHFSTKEKAKEFLMNKLLEWIKNDYKHARKRKVKQAIETIWYNPKHEARKSN